MGLLKLLQLGEERLPIGVSVYQILIKPQAAAYAWLRFVFALSAQSASGATMGPPHHNPEFNIRDFVIPVPS